MAAPRDYSLEDKRLDCQDAFTNARRFHAELRQIYKYFMPWREPITDRAAGGDGGQRSDGDRLVAAGLYDGTGPSAAFSFASQAQSDWLPAFDDFFKFDVGPLFAMDPEAAQRRQQELGIATKIVNGLYAPVKPTCSELFQDLFAGQAHMFVAKGDKNRRPIKAIIAPPLEMATVDDAHGETEKWFWKRNYKLRHLEAEFPDMKPDATLAAQLKNRAARNENISVIQLTWWDRHIQRYRYHAFLETGGDTTLAEETYRTSPWASPRMFKVPGESNGRGLAHIGLPFTLGANKTRELTLRAAAFALLGIWTRRNDGVFNPETAVLAPGKMWKVAYNGGSLGPTLQRLDIPANFDVSSIVMADEREQIKRVLLDDELPEVTDRVRSPTEITGRRARWDRTRGGSTARLATELVTVLAQRGADIAELHGFLPGQLTVDQILTKVTVTSPAAAAQQSGKVDRVVTWLQLIVQLAGPKAMMLVAEIETLIPQIGRWLGVDEEHLRKAADIKQLKAMVAQMVAEMERAEQQQTAQAKAQEAAVPPVPQMKPEAMFLNGGGTA